MLMFSRVAHSCKEKINSLQVIICKSDVTSEYLFVSTSIANAPMIARLAEYLNYWKYNEMNFVKSFQE